MDDLTKPEDEIEKAEQHEARKQLLLRLLDDPQVQRKIVGFLGRQTQLNPRYRPPYDLASSVGGSE
jgi:hypothetical protein